MDHNETSEPYSAKNLGKAVAKDAVMAVAETAAVATVFVAVSLAVVFAKDKLQARKAKKTQIEN